MQPSRAMRTRTLHLLSLLAAATLVACSGEAATTVTPAPPPAAAVRSTPAPAPVAAVASADGPVADGPVADGPVADGPVADGPVADGAKREPVAGRSDIDVKELKRRIDGEQDLVIIDVRSKREYVRGHLAGAQLVPTNELSAKMGELTPYKEREVHVICAVGGRSHQVTDHLVQQGFTSVVNVTGGTKAWQRAGFPVVSGE
jgi:rhodanese-related sulfurtransferase